MVGFRNALHHAGRTARNVYSHARHFAGQVDRHLGSAARIYKQLAPVLAPLANELLGSQRARATDKAIKDAMAGYGNVRSKVVQAHRMGDSLAGMVKKEYPTVQVN